MFGYLRVSTEEQGDSGAGLGAQRFAIESTAQVRDWSLIELGQDIASGATLKRKQLASLLDRLDGGEADGLVVAKLDRVTRSALDFANLLDRAKRGGWSLVILDVGVDMTTPVGEMVAGIMSYVAQFERRRIGERTREGIAAKRRAGTLKGPLGRPSAARKNPELADRVRAMRAAGQTLADIAATLEADGEPAPRGSRWYPSAVARLAA